MKTLIFILLAIIIILGCYAGKTITSQRFTLTNYQTIFENQDKEILDLSTQLEKSKSDLIYITKQCQTK